MSDRPVTVLARRDEFKKAFFRLESVSFTYARIDGSTSERAEHLLFHRGDSVGMLLHDRTSDDLIFVEQLRIATVPETAGWSLEIPAGRIDAGETALAAAQREASEETGLERLRLEPIFSFYPSPGASSERISLFYAASETPLATESVAGLAGEGEEIRVHRIGRPVAFDMLDEGRFSDGKTIMALQWLRGKSRG